MAGKGETIKHVPPPPTPTPDKTETPQHRLNYCEFLDRHYVHIGTGVSRPGLR